ncbi:MAG: hypothetical protein Salg2KO_19590 [Salibacteraceae bacterium]
MNNTMKFTLLISIAIAAHACGNNEQAAPENFPTQKEVNRSLEDINRKFMTDESVMIDAYIERRKWDMSESGTGLRYMIYDDKEGENAKNGQRATVSYKIELLDGREIYNSETLGNKEFLIGQAHVESGLHEGILLMSVGDKAKFILPSHLAHGLSGDQDQIPPRSSVVYDIELIALN